jgi:antitoxin MazE
MVTRVINVGNSRGIRIPNTILKQLEIGDQLEMIVDETHKEIKLKPVSKVRKNWDNAFKKMHETGEDALLISDSIDMNDWEW